MEHETTGSGVCNCSHLWETLIKVMIHRVLVGGLYLIADNKIRLSK